MPSYTCANDVVVVRSGGDIATGVVQKLWRAGFRVVVLEIAKPLTIRRNVALSEAVFSGTCLVEDMNAVLARNARQAPAIWEAGDIPVLVDQDMASLSFLRPAVLVDAIIAKRNTGMRPGLAPVSIALGPGFSAPEEVDCVVETMRGHNLGRLITRGAALPNTGIPGEIGGVGAKRVVHSPACGVVRHVRKLGDWVEENETIFRLDDLPVPARVGGCLRGLIAEGLYVGKGLKCADIDPRPPGDVDWNSISDKARAVGGAVLEAAFMIAGQKKLRLSPVRELESHADNSGPMPGRLSPAPAREVFSL